jgi:hypothetical protein
MTKLSGMKKDETACMLREGFFPSLLERGKRHIKNPLSWREDINSWEKKLREAFFFSFN